jgi:MarR family 2-MHQ and catechol resistance regulon transcriptional repressor
MTEPLSTEHLGPETPPDALPLSAETAAALHLWVVLARAFAALAACASRDVARYGLTPSEFGVLETLYHRGPLLLGDLQRKQLVSSGGMTYLVDRLAGRGLVERRECRTDRRARYAALTPEGEALIRRVFPEHAALMQAALGGLDAGEQRAATELLRRLGLHAEQLSGGEEAAM